MKKFKICFIADRFYVTECITRDCHSGKTILEAFEAFVTKEQVAYRLASTLGAKRKLFLPALKYEVMVVYGNITLSKWHLYPYYWETPNCQGYYDEPQSVTLEDLEEVARSMNDDDLLEVEASYSYCITSMVAPRTKVAWEQVAYEHFAPFKTDAKKWLAANPW